MAFSRRRALLLGLLMAAVAPVASQVDPIDRERHNIIQRRMALREQIRFAYFNREYERVLELCDELETIDPQTGFSQHYRILAREGMTQPRQPPRPAPVSPEIVAPPRAAAPSVAPPSAPPAPVPAAPPAEEMPAPARRSPRGVTVPLLGEVSPLAAGFALGVAVMLLAVAWLLTRVRRRVRAVSSALSADAAEEPEAEVATPEAEHASASGLLDQVFAELPAEGVSSAAAVAPARRGEGLDGVSPKLLATLAAPWQSIDEAVEAIRQQIRTPPAPPQVAAPSKEETTQPVSLEEIGLAPWDLGPTAGVASTPRPPSAAPAAASAKASVRAAPEPVQMLDADEMLFLGVGEGQAPRQPATQRPPAPSLSMGGSLDLGLEPDQELPPMTTADLLGKPSIPPPPPRGRVAPPSDVTGPPLNIDDLLGPMSGAVAPPAGLAEEGVGTKRDKPPEEPPPPPAESRPQSPLAVDLWAEPPAERKAEPPSPDPEATITLPTTAPGAASADDGLTTLILMPDEVHDVLREVPPPTETMAADTPRGEASKPQATGDELFMDYYRQGLSAAQEEDWPQAIHFFNLALSIRPASAEVLRQLRAAQTAQWNRRRPAP